MGGNPRAEQNNKSKRSLTIDSDIEAKVRKIQGRLIDETGNSWSLSKIVNLLVAGGIIATPKLTNDDWRKIRSILNGKSLTLDNTTIRKYIQKVTQD